MKKLFTLLAAVMLGCFAMQAQVADVWINELHYDDFGTDSAEAIEIAGPAGTDLSCYQILLYNGNGGTVYNTNTLSGTIPDEGCGFGAVIFSYPVNGIQNGSPDGIALYYSPTATGCGGSGNDTVIQFLSYEGTITATGGPANGTTSTDIVVVEPGNEQESLQLIGSGTTYNDFTWTGPVSASYGTSNTNQFFCGAPPTTPEISFDVVSSTVLEDTSIHMIKVTIQDPDSFAATTVDVVVDATSTATVSTDFTTSPSQLSFAALDTTSQFITVFVVDDPNPESTETVVLKLRNPNNSATLDDSTHTVNILDNDNLVVSFDQDMSMDDEDVGTVNVALVMSDTSAAPTNVSVMLDTAASTATVGVDFTFAPATLTFPVGTQSGINFSFVVIDDNDIEFDETVVLKLVNPDNGAILGDSVHTFTIKDNDTLPTGPCTDLFFSEYIEGSSNNKAIEIYNPTASAVDLSEYTVVRSSNGGSSFGTLVPQGTLAAGDVFVIANGSADSASIRSKSDTTSSVTFFNGDDALILMHFADTIDVFGRWGEDPGDFWTLPNGGETQNMTLIRNRYIYEGTDDWAVGETQWDVHPIDMTDSLGFHNIAPCGTPPPPELSFDSASVTRDEAAGSYTVQVNISTANTVATDVDVVLDAGSSTATSGSDFSYTNSTVTFPASMTTPQTVSITITDDALPESAETVVLKLRNATSGAIITADSTFTLTIEDNDVPPEVTFVGTAISESEAGDTVRVRLAINNANATATSVDVGVTAGNATNSTDYNFTDPTTVTWPANSSDTMEVVVAIVDDQDDEANEQIILGLSNQTNMATIGIGAYTITIIDNDSSTIGINESFEAGISLYPNPVTNALILESNEQLTKLTITDAIGREVIVNALPQAGIQTIDVTALPSGLYLLKVEAGEQFAIKRFIKE